MLRSKRPDTVRKEVAMHLLAYNLIRGIMAEAARGRDVQPRELSFNGVVDHLPRLEETHLYEPRQIAADIPVLLDLILQTASAIDRTDTSLARSNAGRSPTGFSG